MKKKICIFCLVACVAVTGTVTYQTTPIEQTTTQATVVPESRPLSTLEDDDRAYTPPTENKATVTAITANVATTNQPQDTIPTETDFEPKIPNEDQGFQQPQDTDRDNHLPEPNHVTDKAEPTESQPKNGDTRVVNGQQQGYLIGFGWVDYMGENICTRVEGMYEIGNK